MMQVVIRETGERRTLSYVDPATRTDWVLELIGGSGAIGDYIEHDAKADVYVMGQADYAWWAEYIRLAQQDEDELYYLRHRYGNIVDDIWREEWAQINVGDYDAHHRANERAIARVRELGHALESARQRAIERARALREREDGGR
jgi:hypothetical protein